MINDEGLMMKAEDLQKIIRKTVGDIAVELKDEFDKNFERQAFFSKKWQRRKSPIRNDGRAILTDTGQLRNSIMTRTTDNSITFYTDLPYAGIHNEGGEIVVTARMKRFFWAKYREANGGSWKRGAGSDEAKFWQALALKKVGSAIRIPRRKFLGTSPEVEKAVKDIIEENIGEYVKGLDLLG